MKGSAGHQDRKQDLAGTLIRSIISGGAGPAATTLRPQVLEMVRHCAEEYGMGSAFVTTEYLERRTPGYQNAGDGLLHLYGLPVHLICYLRKPPLPDARGFSFLEDNRQRIGNRG